MLKIQRPKSFAEQVSDVLRSQIISGERDMGEALSESKIAKELGVSRTPVREAFARLELEGLVHTEPQRGTFVFTLGRCALVDICDVRVCLETTALHKAMERDPAGLAKSLKDITRKMTKARKKGDDRDYLNLDTEFHQKFFDHAKNDFLNDAYQTIAAKMACLRNKLGNHPEHMEKSYGEHLEIADLLAESETDRAIEVMIRHIGRKDGSYWNI
ncbi:GntR family transcriptional regulator [Roseibium aggregatum]|uniref:GntR family transcriptional regulator n=1 Tax=Roseibium aggregatum TaxID=187304 RepID=A0A939EG34_9HYPH|nr:GntR family transcriptional regulator [Roseibium aggregatum]MBN9671543.1 GntR family transcriptional regulator [Roseibium aggregatum]